jgi:thiamine kinase-like enzyme
MDDVLNFMQKNKEFFPKVHHNACLTHADYKPINLLYTGKDICVLDWEFAHAGIGLLDFAILLRHRKLFAFDQQALEYGYTDAGGTLPEEWYRSALITDFVNILTLLDGPSERPKLFEQLKQSIQNTLLHWVN